MLTQFSTSILYFAEMDAARRRAYIKQQATMKKQVDGTFKGTGSSNPSTKRKPQEKTNHPQKKPKTAPETVVGLKAKTKKTVTPIGIGRGKGLMKGPDTVPKKPPVLLREDSKYALEKLTSIISVDDYKDLSNHATEAMGETGLFCIAQVITSVHLPFIFLVLPFF